MKDAELEKLWTKLSGDFRSIEPHLRDLDKHLTLRSHLTGYSLGDVETKTWQTLRANKVAMGSIRKNGLPNLTRWFTFIEQSNPQIHEASKSADAAAKKPGGANYNLALQDTDKGVVTRFLPEPSGYLHIGHAKAALLSDYFGHVAYKGKMRLRLDDTNPSKESEEFQDAIVEDLALMGIKADSLTYTSDYFDYLYDMCRKLISMGKAYADDTGLETMRAQRMDGIPSKRRDRSVDENLRIFEEMKKGSDEGLVNCIRAKISADDPNKALRDPVIYRCNVKDAHHRTGRKWNMYPMYDFACPVVDSHEGVTHALRSTEYTDRNPQYQWFLDTLGLRQVHMWDFSRINLIKTFLSKRKLAKLVESGKVWGWDDPRMPTIRGVRRRGMTVPALRDFILRQGPSRNVVVMDWTSFWNTNKKEIDPVVPRHTALLAKDMVKAKLTGSDVPSGVVVEQRPKHPKNASVGTKDLVLSSEIYLDQVDAKSFAVGEEVTLMGWGNAIVRDPPASSSSERDAVKTMTLELNLKGDFKATEKKVTWLSAQGLDLVPAELWDFDYLITKDKLEEEDKVEDFLNPVTATMEEARCDGGVGLLKADDIIQLERRGFYRVDKGLKDWKGDEAGIIMTREAKQDPSPIEEADATEHRRQQQHHGHDLPCPPSKSAFRELGLLDRFLALWILLAMLVGIVVGNFAAGAERVLQQGRFIGVSIPIAVGLLVMMYPILCNVRFESLHLVLRQKRLWRQLGFSLVINWLIAPFFMLALASAFLPDQPGLRKGLMLVGLGRCIAMVLIWNELAGGDGEYCAVLVAVNSLLQLLLFAPMAIFLIGVVRHDDGVRLLTYSVVASSVGVFLGIPLAAAVATRLSVRKLAGERWFDDVFMRWLSPWSLIGLLYTVVVLFAAQGRHVVHQIVSVVRVAAPLVVYFMAIFFGALWATRRLGFGYRLGCAQSFTAASNNFELAIAVAVATFGPDGDEALASSVGPLIEVPVLLTLVYLVRGIGRRWDWREG
ncbi:hypothetical protein L249_7619 [Ophiocordyceps polyrhachis-furcata BCC 54312]|uniref:glutamate--tRNA ligase n=1 Tax=Ophiocordyceps polyrhachis-furcata BCC 54312 TaxID=1330021 RepID=A0A367LBD1_9HYPO|nr:hypothetical protein L249_7619 [Ophiocordyceps polyrhachis-furcata BCC 54312]